MPPSALIRKDLKLNRVRIRGGEFNLIYENKTKSILTQIFRLSEEKSEEEKIPQGKTRISAKEISITDFRFRYLNKELQEREFERSLGSDHINFTNLDFSDLNIRISDFKLRDAVFSGRIERLSCIDKSGFNVRRLTSDMEMGYEKTIFRNLSIDVEHSRILCPSLTFEYGSPRGLNNFTKNVVMTGLFRRTTLNFATLGKIVPKLDDNSLILNFNGDVTGTVSGLAASDLNITVDNLGSISKIFAEGSLTGISTGKKLSLTLDTISVNSNKEGVMHIVGNFASMESAANFIPDVSYSFGGSVKGHIDSLNIAGNLESDIGSLETDIILYSTIEPKKSTGISGKVIADNLDLGSIVKLKGLEWGSFDSDVDFQFFTEQKEFRVNAKYLSIDSLRFNKYTYTNIYIDGYLTPDIFNGNIRSGDPNFGLIFSGSVSLPGANIKTYRFDLDLPYIDLRALNFDKRFSKSDISLNMSANVANSPIGDYIGDINIRDIRFDNDYGAHDLGRMDIRSFISGNMQYTSVTSGFIDIDYRSSGSITDFISKLGSLVSATAIGKDIFHYSPNNSTAKESYSLNITTRDIAELTQFIKSDLFIAENSNIKINISPDNILDMSVLSGALALGDNYIRDLSVNLSTKESFNITTKAGELALGGLKIKNNLAKISGKDNLLKIQYNFSNENGQKNDLNLSSLISFDKIDLTDGKLIWLADMQLDSSYMTLFDTKWEISPASIALGNKYYEINGLKINNNGQDISIQGAISNNSEDILRADIHNFDTHFLNSLMSKKLGIEGVISGSAEISNVFKTPNLLVDLYSDSISIHRDNIGSLRVTSKRDLDNNNIGLFVENRLGELQPLNISGTYKPEESFMDLKIDLSSFPLSVVELFTENIISNTKGHLSGHLNVTSKNGHLNITGNRTRLDNFSFLVDYINVPYTINGPVNFNGNSIIIDGMEIRDQFNNTGTVSGRVNHNSLKDIRFESKITLQNMFCLNTTEKTTQSFYGNAYATGTVDISGNGERIQLNVDAATSRNGSVHIPMGKSGQMSKFSILTIENPESERDESNSYAQFIERNKKGRSNTQLDIKLRLNALDNTELNVEIDKSVGNVLRARGAGVINMEIHPSTNIFDIKGNYTVNQGSYKFVYLGFGSRDFTIDNGGTIMFNGDIMNAALNLTATYRTKATIAPLIGESSDYRRNVDCSIHMGGRLSDPELKFSIDVPDLAPSYKARVESALSTEDKILTQFMALMITGSFVVNEGGQGVGFNNSTILYSNASEIISNQVSNIFRQLGIPIDLGFNYQVDQKRESEMFDMAVSAQLFNNRVIVNGSLGSTTHYNSNRDIAGDIDIEIKIDQDGRVRVNLFSHSADPYTNYLDDTQRNGLGIIYQNEFNNLREMLDNIFLPRKKREELEEEKIREIIRKAEKLEVRK